MAAECFKWVSSLLHAACASYTLTSSARCSTLQGAQQRRMHDMQSLISESPVIQPEAVMKMLSPEVSQHWIEPNDMPAIVLPDTAGSAAMLLSHNVAGTRIHKPVH